jgi:hypothetical protein
MFSWGAAVEKVPDVRGEVRGKNNFNVKFG